MESSKSTAHHIKQVASEPQVAQVNLMNQVPPYKKKFDPNQAHQRKDRCSKCGDSKHIESFKCPARKFKCKTYNKYGHFTSLCYKKKVYVQSRTPKAHQLQAGVVYTKEDCICSHQVI